MELLRRGLVTNDTVALGLSTDAPLSADIAYLRAAIEAIRYAGHGHGDHNEQLSPSLFAATWEAHRAHPPEAAARFRDAIPWLGTGRCRIEAAVNRPDAYETLGPADPGWPESLRARHSEVQRELQRVRAHRVRCAPGVALTVVLTTPPRSGEFPRILDVRREQPAG